MTPVKIGGNFGFTPWLKSYDKFARTHYSKFTPNTCYLLLASGMESCLQLLGSSVKNSVP